jgi:hypothetical protein
VKKKTPGAIYRSEKAAMRKRAEKAAQLAQERLKGKIKVQIDYRTWVYMTPGEYEEYLEHK